MRDNPFQSPGQWLKGAIHVHTDRSDGKVTPEHALEAYRQQGYDFLVFGDHWHVTTLEDPAGQLIVIPGAEYDARFEGGPAGFHFMAVGMPAGHHEDLRRLRGDPYGLAEALGRRCDYLVLAHPYWSALTTELIAPLAAVSALEVYNHGCEVEDALGHSAYVWDQLLARGHRWDALAVDDAHWRIDDRFGGWVMVKARDRSAAGVVEALRAGRFYATAGPEIHDVEFLAPRRLRVRTAPAASVLFRCNRSLGNGLHAAGQSPLTRAEHEIGPGAVFVRVEVTDPAGRKAWTNPFYLPAPADSP